MAIIRYILVQYTVSVHICNQSLGRGKKNIYFKEEKDHYKCYPPSFLKDCFSSVLVGDDIVNENCGGS